ncbi:MAG: zinc metalloprotease [Nocardioidaceae bacterium]|nr:zinc metalloprotease [Nocardioidaceae bacterium]
MTRLRRSAAAALGATALAFVLAPPPAQAMPTPEPAGAKAECIELEPKGAADARGGERSQGKDHRDVSLRQQRAIERRTNAILKAEGVTASETATLSATIPVYVHVMLDRNGRGNVTAGQISDQIAVLNKTFSGGESSAAANTGFTFTLAGTDRYYNNNWHYDRQSTKYRSQTRQGGANALNIWLVEFDYLGIATFPWDYNRNPGIDGIRVHYDSLPGGSIANYNLGETATHEAGHWFGLYHTFQGGCTATNDEVADTPAQGSATNGCPEGRDSCSLPGFDPIHNYMDYSYDSCYNQFTADQSTRSSQMFTAYRS